MSGIVEMVSIKEKQFKDFRELLALPGKTGKQLKLKRIQAVSAYYDSRSIKQLIKYMHDCGANAKGKKSANLELIIVLDRRGIRGKIDETLGELDKKIKDEFGKRNESGIYLSSLGELFHSKGYLVEGKHVGRCAVGSLNLTQKGLERNEELLAFFDYEISKERSYASQSAKHFREYVKKILEDKEGTHRASEKNKTPSRINSHRDFFLAGSLYYEANEVGPFGFKLDFPDKVSKRPSDLSSHLTNKSSDILDVRELLIELLKEKSIEFPKENKRERSRWKDYCFQTCYGYWAPDCHSKGIYDEIKKNKDCAKNYRTTFCRLSKNKEELYDKLLKECRRIVDRGIDAFRDAFRDGEKWKFLSVNGRDLDLDEKTLRKEWDDWFEKLREKNNEEFISRLCHYVQSVKMPDVWEDGEATEVFEDSFKNSFRYYKEHKKGSTNKLFHFFDSFQDFKNIINAVRRLAERSVALRALKKELEQPMPKRLPFHLNALVAQGRLEQKESRQGARYCLPGAQSDDLSLEERIHDWLKQNDS